MDAPDPAAAWVVEPARGEDLDRLAGMHVFPSVAACLEAPRREPARFRYYRDKLSLLWAMEPAGVFLVRASGTVAGFMMMTGDALRYRRRAATSVRAWLMFLKLALGFYGWRWEMLSRFGVLAGQGSGLLRVRAAAAVAPPRQRAHIFGGIVAEEHRGQGILKALHVHSGDYARRCGADRLSANILPENSPALAAAHWIGFTECGRSREIPGETLYLERPL